MQHSRQSKVSSNDLSSGQIVKSALWGVILWFTAAMYVRYGAPHGMFGSSAMVIEFMLTIPVIGLAIVVAQKWAGLTKGQYLASNAVTSVVAIVFDCVFLNWFRSLYGTNNGDVLTGFIWILWAVGAGLAISLVVDRRR